ncbi:MAG TPA: DPP IV N-terminal domain-containing protein [Longimicrobiaceae bacterium]
MARAQGTLEDYRRAERFLGRNASELVYHADVNANWIGEEDRFWYRSEGPDRTRFLLVDAARGTRAPAFDHARMAEGLGRSLGDTLDPDDLPFQSIEFNEAGDSVEVGVRGDRWQCSLGDYGCAALPGEAGVRGRSPDGRWQAFVRAHDLWVRSLETGEEIRLTDDGAPGWDYATPLPNPLRLIEERTETLEQPPSVFWSPDSTRLLTYRIDSRDAGRLTVVQHAPDYRMRPASYEYVYPLPQDSVLPTAQPVLFSIDGWRRIPVETTPIEMQYYGGTGFRWSEDGSHALAVVANRGYTRQEVREIDPETGAVRVVLEEVGDPIVDTSRGSILRELEGGRILWGSERDGYNHLYLLDAATGEVVRQLTRGPWVVDGVERIDEEAGRVYFTARGREPGRDPYLLHAYSVGLDGSGQTLLTPEPADHDVSFSPGGDYFVDTYSRVDQAPVSVLRRSADGAVVLPLERADIGRLLATGWKQPEPFRAMARDGRTEIHGLLWFPSTFDPSRKYPVVEQIYTGPHGFFTPKSFGAWRNSAQGIAELGFIVIMVDGLGTAGRGREFQRLSFRNLGDSGFEDHIGAMRQLAAERPYMDLTRVGIYGHSAGGYSAARGVLAHPEFYDVAVASAGNHDHQLDKAWWNTQWMGHPIGEHYTEQSNLALAPRLQGKLFLAHGDIDENVPVSATIRMADALIEANKDFDLLIMPNQPHGFGGHPYFVRRRWDYFVRHLLDVEPPVGYEIGAD